MKKGWHRWFAWYPVVTVEHKWAWFRSTWRFWEALWDGYWVYSDRPYHPASLFADTLNEDGTRRCRP